MYLYEQGMDLYDFYYERLKDEVTYGGHVDFNAYLFLLNRMDEDKMKDWERRMMAEIKELRYIREDILALNAHIRKRGNEVILPDWIMDPQLRQEAYQLLTFANKYETVDLIDTKLIPTPLYRGPDFEERLREVMDVEQIIANENEELRQFANERIPLPGKKLSDKDGDLISKMSVIAKAVEVDEVPIFGIDINEEYEIDNLLRENLPTEKRILVDEIYKILMFNNIDPETYTISFWSDYFNISPSTIRNVVNYMAYPIVDQKTKRVKSILYFQDTELAKNTKLVGQLDRETYLGYLETDYYSRVKEEYQDEQGLFGRVDVPSYLNPHLLESSDSGQLGEQKRLDQYLSNQIGDILEDDKVLTQID